MVETSEPVAHKLPGAGSSLLSSKGIPAAARTATCTDSHRQYVCGVVYKSPGRNSLQGAVQAGDGYPAMGGLQPSLYQSNAYPRSSEPGGRHAFEEGYASRRVEITPRVGSDDLEPLRESGSGSVRNKREHALPAVLLPVSLPAGRGRADIALASGQAVCISSDQDTATGVMQDQGGTSVGVTQRTELAKPALVPRLDGAAGGAALADPHQEGYAIPGGRLGVAPQPGNVEPSCVATSGLLAEMSALQLRVRDTLTEARAPSTRRLYASKWGLFVKWCDQAHIDPATCTVSDVLSFL